MFQSPTRVTQIYSVDSRIRRLSRWVGSLQVSPSAKRDSERGQGIQRANEARTSPAQILRHYEKGTCKT